MPEHNPGQLGGTMRLGRRRTVFVEDCESTTSMPFSFPYVAKGEMHLSTSCSRSFCFLFSFFALKKS